MKHLNTYITEYIIKKKLDKPIDSENNYKYSPINKEQLINNINECIDLGEYNLNVIDVSSIKDMSKLFRSVNLDKIKRGSKLDISKWDVSNVVDTEGMFDGCENFDCDLSNWNVSKIRDASTMFYDCLNFTGKGLDKWKLSSIRNMNYMFCGCEKLDCDLSKWNIDKNVSMKKALKDCNLKNKPSWYKE